MATFTTIPDTDLDANSPITENLMLALRDNPLAIQQGDASAPKIQNAAFADGTLTGAKLADGTIPFSKISMSLSGGDTTATVPALGYYYIPSGLYMLTNESYTQWLQIYVNGAWRDASVSSENAITCAVISNGSSVRMYNNAHGSQSIYLKKAG